MICGMSPPRPDYTREWREFAATVEQPDQPICPFCNLRHERDPYCTTARRFFAWLQNKDRPNEW